MRRILALLLLLLPLTTAYSGFSETQRFSLSTQQLVFSEAEQDKTITLSATDSAIYNTYYTSFDDGKWTPHNLSSSTDQGWITSGSPTASITIPKGSSTDNYIIIYSCSRSGQAWDCHDGWQILQVNTTIEQATCSDGIQNQGETGTDCGGPCFACASGGPDHLRLANGIDILFVDNAGAGCDDSHTRTQALDPETPWCTPNGGLSKMQGGDTMYILEGAYNGQNTLQDRSFDRNVTLAAYPGDTVVLSRYATYGHESAPNALWTRVDAGGSNVWKTTIPSSATSYPRVYHANSVKFFTWYAYSGLLGSTYPDSCWYDPSARELYVKLSGSRSPNDMPLYITKDYSALAIAHTTLSENAYIIIANLTFRHNIISIEVDGQRNVIVDNCSFYGGHNAVDVNNEDTTGLGTIIIRNSFINGMQNSDWYDDDTKSNGQEETTGILVQNNPGPVYIYGNTFDSWHGAITLKTDSAGECNGSRIYENLFINGLGSQLEIEDFCSNSVWHHNRIYDSARGVSFAPADASASAAPCEFHHNQIVLKGVISSTTGTTDSFAIKAEYRNSRSVDNWVIHHNTFYGRGRALNAMADGTLKNTVFRDNIFFAETGYALFRTGLSSEGMLYDYNLYYLAPGGTRPFQRWNSNSVDAGFGSLAEALASSYWDGTWDIHSREANPQFSNLAGNDIRPSAGSPACTMSSTGSYVGALACS